MSVILCDKGCNLVATHITKTGRHVCHKQGAKCPTASTKGKTRKSYAKPQIYIGDKLCSYCNVHKAQYLQNNGKLSCGYSGANCIEIRKRAGKAISDNRSEIDPNTGVCKGKILASKIAEIKKTNIDSSGKNSHERNAINVAKIKFTKIDPETGLNVHQRTAKKVSKWYATANGIAFKEKQRTITSSAMKAIDPITGMRESERRSQKAVLTKLNTIDCNGLNGFERSTWKNKNSGFVGGLYYQSSNEKRFLELMSETHALSEFSRGTGIKYVFNGKEKTYLPDYMHGNKLYEIKSKYTLFGPNNVYLAQNLAKLDAASSLGYEVYLVVDGEIQLFALARTSLREISL